MPIFFFSIRSSVLVVVNSMWDKSMASRSYSSALFEHVLVEVLLGFVGEVDAKLRESS